MSLSDAIKLIDFQKLQSQVQSLTHHTGTTSTAQGKKLVRVKRRFHKRTVAEASKTASKRKRTYSYYEGIARKTTKRKVKRSSKQKWSSLRTRSSPRQLFLGLSGLNKKQKQGVKDMGFGELLGFSVDGIPAKLGHYVVDILDVKTMQLKVPGGHIKVDKESVHKLLGIPCEGVNFYSLVQTVKLDPKVQSWRDRYSRNKYISTTKIVKKIEAGDAEDNFYFKLDFLMLFLTTMVTSYKNGLCREDIPKYFTSDTDFSKIDWCSYVIDSMKKCKNKWKRCDVDSPFTGPLTILTLLYVDSMECQGMTIDPGIKAMHFWTKEQLSIREEKEIQNGGFGRSCKKKELSVANYGMENDTIEMDSEHEAIEVEAQLAVVKKRFDVFMLHKKRFEKTMGEIYRKNWANEEVLMLKHKYETSLLDSPQWPEPDINESDIAGTTIRDVLDDLNGSNVQVGQGILDNHKTVGNELEHENHRDGEGTGMKKTGLLIAVKRNMVCRLMT